MQTDDSIGEPVPQRYENERSRPDGGPSSRNPVDVERKIISGGYVEENSHSIEYENDTEQMELAAIDQLGLNNRKVCYTVAAIAFCAIFIVVLVIRSAGSKASDSGSKTPDPSHYSQKGYEDVTDMRGSKYTILTIYEREPKYYTQGYYFVDSTGDILESAGYWGRSSIQYVEKTEPRVPGEHGRMTVKKSTPNDANEFAEGCTLVEQNGKTYIYQLTWQSRKIFRYNQDLTLDRTFSLPSQLREGWGLSHNPNKPSELFATDSGANIYSLTLNDQGADLSVVSTKQIRNSGGQPIYSLNELEHTGKILFSNVYLTNNIELIDLNSSSSVREINMSRLWVLANDAYRKIKGYDLNSQQCLNGIAYDKKEDVFYLTGKEWPLVFKIRFPREYYA